MSKSKGDIQSSKTARWIDIMPLSKRDKIFLSALFGLLLCLGIFQFWLGFPGFVINNDIVESLSLNKNNHQPIIISAILELLYAIDGRHTYYLFVMNLCCFYAGLSFLVAGFYIRFRSHYVLLLLFPLCIGNIYLGNFVSMSYVGLYNLLILGYSMLLFGILVPLSSIARKCLYCATMCVFFLAILWRHNAIFSVFPASFVFAYVYTNSLRARVAFIACAAVLCVGIVVCVPKVLLTSSQALPAHHIFLHQMIGACAESDDLSCFKDEWFVVDRREWKEIKRIYYENPLFADYLNGYFSVSDGLFLAWARAIFKYPLNYFHHQQRFFKAMWFGNPKDDVVDDVGHIGRSIIKNPKELQRIYNNDNRLSDFPLSERKITLTPLRLAIYSFIYNHAIILNHSVGVALGFIVLAISVVLLVSRFCNVCLVYSFACAFACVGSAIFIAGFSPVDYSRYFAPILPLGLLALIGFFAFILTLRNK